VVRRMTRLSNPDDGALCQTCADRVYVEHSVTVTVANGAKVLTGGSRNGFFFEPTVINRPTGVLQLFEVDPR
jgi:acyl-CoA reductase-like NAD-dependent aldehyde dehydrogenase